MFKLLELIKLGFTRIFLALPFTLTHRVAVFTAGAAAAATSIAAYLACYAAISASVQSLLGDPGVVGSGGSGGRSWLEYVGMFVPSNWSGVLSLVLSAYVCRAAYIWTREQIDMWSKA